MIRETLSFWAYLSICAWLSKTTSALSESRSFKSRFFVCSIAISWISIEITLPFSPTSFDRKTVSFPVPAVASMQRRGSFIICCIRSWQYCVIGVLLFILILTLQFLLYYYLIQVNLATVSPQEDTCSIFVISEQRLDASRWASIQSATAKVTNMT